MTIPEPQQDPPVAGLTPQRSINWKWLSVGLAASPLVFAAGRILIYSGGDPVVLRTIVRTLNVQSVLVGSILPLTTAIFSLAVVAWTYYNDVRIRVKRLLEGRPLLRGVLVVVGVILVILSPLLNLLLFASITVGLGLGTFFAKRRVQKAKPPGAVLRRLQKLTPDKPLGPSNWLAVPIITLLFLFVGPGGMWLPLERVTTAPDAKQTVYVLDDSEGWMTTIDKVHRVKLLHSVSVKSRVVCDQGQYTSLTTLMLGVHAVAGTNCSGD